MKNRKFDNEFCSEQCPYYIDRVIEECDLYNIEIEIGEDFSNPYDPYSRPLRNKKCLNDIKPNANTALIKELKEINKKLDLVISKMK